MVTVFCGADMHRFEPFEKHGCVIALGFFDGVHVAHRELLCEARAAADRLSLPLAVFTFSGDGGIKPSAPRLYSDKERLELLSQFGADYAFVADFDSISGVSEKAFAEDWLIGIFSARVAVCGYNFRFGKNAAGDAEYLKAVLAAHGAECKICGEVTLRGERVSTTRIRELLTVGDMSGAAAFLGAPYYISGTVEHGCGRGHTIGIPTVNLPISAGASVLPHGVYSSVVTACGRAYRAVTNIGKCPTFGARIPHAEATILDFDGDLYGESVRIYLIEYLRAEMEFSSSDALIEQIKLDTDRAKELDLEEIWQEIGRKLP